MTTESEEARALVREIRGVLQSTPADHRVTVTPRHPAIVPLLEAALDPHERARVDVATPPARCAGGGGGGGTARAGSGGGGANLLDQRVVAHGGANGTVRSAGGGTCAGCGAGPAA